MPESQTKSAEKPEIKHENSPKLPQPFLSTYAFLKNAYPLNDGKRVAKEVAIGAPSFLTGYIIHAAAKKVSSTLSPSLNLFKIPTFTLPEKNHWWSRYLPLNLIINNKIASPKTAMRFHAPISAISEELFFRGLLMPGMQRGLQASGMSEKSAKIGSMVGNSLLFSALHPKVNRKAFFLSALTYSALTHYANGSLIPATAGHMANNHIAMKIAERKFGKK